MTLESSDAHVVQGNGHDWQQQVQGNGHSWQQHPLQICTGQCSHILGALDTNCISPLLIKYCDTLQQRQSVPVYGPAP